MTLDTVLRDWPLLILYQGNVHLVYDEGKLVAQEYREFSVFRNAAGAESTIQHAQALKTIEEWCEDTLEPRSWRRSLHRFAMTTSQSSLAFKMRWC